MGTAAERNWGRRGLIIFSEVRIGFGSIELQRVYMILYALMCDSRCTVNSAGERRKKIKTMLLSIHAYSGRDAQFRADHRPLMLRPLEKRAYLSRHEITSRDSLHSLISLFCRQQKRLQAYTMSLIHSRERGRREILRFLFSRCFVQYYRMAFDDASMLLCTVSKKVYDPDCSIQFSS